MYYLPGVIAARVKAITGKSQEVVIEFRGSHDKLVLPAGEKEWHVRGKNQEAGEYKAWEVSDFREVSASRQDEALKGRVSRICEVTIGDTKFDTWGQCIKWMRQEQEGVAEGAHTYLMHFPVSVWEGLQAKARLSGTTVRQLVLDAVQGLVGA